MCTVIAAVAPTMVVVKVVNQYVEKLALCALLLQSYLIVTYIFKNNIKKTKITYHW